MLHQLYNYCGSFFSHFYVCVASEHLTGVRSEVLEKIRLLQEELGLIDTHLSDQKTKYEEVNKCTERVIICNCSWNVLQLCQQETSLNDKTALLSRTIEGLKVFYLHFASICVLTGYVMIRCAVPIG